MKIVNTKILAHPMNWIVVLLMLIFAGIAGHLLLSLVGVSPSTGDDKSGLPAGQQNQS